MCVCVYVCVCVCVCVYVLFGVPALKIIMVLQDEYYTAVMEWIDDQK